MKEDERKTVARILKVNHAGETGAIKIYQAQIFIAKFLHSDLVNKLSEMLGHEIEHCRLFREAMPPRNARPCRAMWLWGLGGWVLGSTTALAGKNMIWICTEAIEETVHQHLEEQLTYLQNRDAELAEIIESIREEELAHMLHAKENVTSRSFVTGFVRRTIVMFTEAVIWLSTQGDSSRMVRAIRS